MRRALAAILALCCAGPAFAQNQPSVFDTAKTLTTNLGSAVVYDGAKPSGGSAPLVVPARTSSAMNGPLLQRHPLAFRTPDLRLDSERMKARDKGVWIGLGAFVAMEAAWNISYHVKHPWGMGPESPAYLASFGGFIAFPLIGEAIGKSIDRRHDRRKEY